MTTNHLNLEVSPRRGLQEGEAGQQRSVCLLVCVLVSQFAKSSTYLLTTHTDTHAHIVPALCGAAATGKLNLRHSREATNYQQKKKKKINIIPAQRFNCLSSLPKNVFLLKASALFWSFANVNEWPRLAMCNTCNGFSLIRLNSSCPNPECDQVSSLNASEREFQAAKCCGVWRHIQLNSLTSRERLCESSILKMESSHSLWRSEGTASIGRHTHSQRRLFIWLCLCRRPRRTSIPSQRKLHHFLSADESAAPQTTCHLHLVNITVSEGRSRNNEELWFNRWFNSKK